MKRFLLLTTLLATLCVSAQEAEDARHREMHRLHNDSEAYIRMLENPGRDGYQKPDQVVAALRLSRDETIADIGAGSGYFSFRIAQSLGPEGTVIAVDINPDMIKHMNQEIKKRRISNVITVLAEAANPKLQRHSVDRIFFCDTWHHIGNQRAYLELLKQALKQGGQIVMIDYKKVDLPVGPPIDMKIRRSDLIAQMRASGFRLLREETFLPYQYFLVFEMP